MQGINYALYHYNSVSHRTEKMRNILFQNIQSLTPDYKGRIWIGANNMLLVYIIDEKRTVILDETDGVKPNGYIFTPMSMSLSRNIYLGGTQGLTVINKDIEISDNDKPAVNLLSINLDGREYYVRQGMTMDQFYELMRAAQGVPTTAAITMLQWREIYDKYADEGYTDVLHVSINGSGSSTYANAQQAAEALREERPDCKMRIHLIDSHTYSYVYGGPVVQAARRLRNGAEVGYVCAELEAAFARQEIVLSAFSLKQMKKSGRISAAAAFAGELLGLRPIISLIDGVTKVEDKVRGDAAVPAAMIKQVRKRMDYPDGDVHYMLGCTDIPNVKELEKLCRKEFGRGPDAVFKLGAAVASNTGPDAMAIVYQGVPRR